MPGINFKLLGASKLISAFNSRDSIKGPLGSGIRKATLKMEALTRKATVVDTGRLRSSITHRFAGSRGFVGTNVRYASFVEYGTQKMEARHAEGGRARILGVGMFTFALEQLGKWLGTAEKEIARDIEKRFK